MFCKDCGKDLKESTVCECVKPPASPYAYNVNPQQPESPYSNQPNQPDMWSYKAKTTAAFVLGIISMVWSIISLVVAVVEASSGRGGTGAFLTTFWVSIFPFGLALAGVLIMVPLKVPFGHDRTQRTMNLVLCAIAITVIFVSCLIALFG